MEKNIDDFLDTISEAKKENRMDTPGFKLNKKEIENLALRLSSITKLGQKLDDLDEFRKLIQSTKKYNYDLSKGFEFVSEIYSKKINSKDISKTLKNKVDKIDKIFSSTSNEDLTDTQKKDIEKAAEEILNYFKTATNKQSHVNDDFKETGINTWQVKVEQTFPCKLEIGKETFYGLVRPPTGIITWQGPTARGAAKKVGVPLKLPIMNKGDKKNPKFIVKRGADEYGKFISKFQNIKNQDRDFDFDDSDKAKAKVVDAMTKAGANYDAKAYKQKKYLSHSEKAISKIKDTDIASMMDEELSSDEKDLLFTEGFIRNVGFWQNITEIL